MYSLHKVSGTAQLFFLLHLLFGIQFILIVSLMLKYFLLLNWLLAAGSATALSSPSYHQEIVTRDEARHPYQSVFVLGKRMERQPSDSSDISTESTRRIPGVFPRPASMSSVHAETLTRARYAARLNEEMYGDRFPSTPGTPRTSRTPSSTSSLASLQKLNLGTSAVSLRGSGGSGPITPTEAESQPVSSSLQRSGGSGSMLIPQSQSGPSSPSRSGGSASPLTPRISKYDLEKGFIQPDNAEALVRSKARREARRRAEAERAKRYPPTSPHSSNLSSPRNDSSRSSPKTSSASSKPPTGDAGVSSSPKAPRAPQEPARGGNHEASAANIQPSSRRKDKQGGHA